MDIYNPFLALPYESAMEELGGAFFEVVSAAAFPCHILRWRNDQLLPRIGLLPEEVSDDHFIEAFGHLRGVRSFLALAYHGHQFGIYNPHLGDGRGFLYGQVRGTDGQLYDFGTKGSGTTPFSRRADGRLTLKGGVREVLAGEALHRMGVRTSRCLSLIETGEDLWRGDEPSPTRSAVMVRLSRSHIRFGTFERLHRLGRPDLIKKLLDHAISIYYPHLLHSAIAPQTDRYLLFYQELVQKVAALVAQWMAAGFCHAVLNTDNMSITGESFDYGPYAFIPTYDPQFTAAYFDYSGRYAYGNQPIACYWNLEMLQVPLAEIMPQAEMQAVLASYKEAYINNYEERMCERLGITNLTPPDREALVAATIQFLYASKMGYNEFFRLLRQSFDPTWREEPDRIFANWAENFPESILPLWEQWRTCYHHALLSQTSLTRVPHLFAKYNPTRILLRSEIEAIWEPIVQYDNWQPFLELLLALA